LPRALHQSNATSLLDSFETRRAIFEQTRQNDTNGAYASVAGQRAEQRIDAVAAITAILHKMNYKPRTNGQVPVWPTYEAGSLLEGVTFTGDKHRQMGGARQDLP
jgi:hypothetical protein